MNAERSTSLFERALVRHLAQFQGLRGVQAFLGEGDGWTEAARLGEVPEGAHTRLLRAYSPEAGGAVEPLDGTARGWLASYMIGRAGLDLVLVLHLADLEPAELQTRLAEIESKVGWLLVAALSERRTARESRAEGGEIGARLLLDAAQARSRRALADQWIARLESALTPDLAAVLWMRGDDARLVAISGGGLIERPGDERSLLESLAETAVRAREPMTVGPADASTTSAAGALPAAPDDVGDVAAAHDREETLARVERIGARRALLLPVFEGERAAAVVALLYAGEAGPDLGHEGGEVLADTLGEALAIQKRAHPGLLRRLGNWGAGLAMAVFGRTAWRLKAVAVLASSWRRSCPPGTDQAFQRGSRPRTGGSSRRLTTALSPRHRINSATRSLPAACSSRWRTPTCGCASKKRARRSPRSLPSCRPPGPSATRRRSVFWRPAARRPRCSAT